MTHYLRTSENKTIIECDVNGDDLSTCIHVWNYSSILLDLSESNRSYARSFAREFDDLSEIRGLWWEREKEFGDWNSVDEFIKSKFHQVSKIWGLNYITD
jgi:hypothetical protein